MSVSPSFLISTQKLASLPADYRDVIMLRHVEGMPFAKIAHEMGRSPGAVRMLWFRAIKQLRARLELRGIS